MIITLVGNCNCLDHHFAVIFEESTASTEIAFIKLVAYRFDHFDRHELVELPRQVAIVIAQQRNSVFKTGLGNSLAGVIVLFF